MGRLLGVAAALAALQPATPVRAQQGPLASLSWLAGCWEARAGDRTVEEQWMRPLGQRMLGASRTTRDSTTLEYEWLAIAARDDRMIYEARPSGQAPAEFPATRITGDQAVFANPRHDFPQEITYARRSADSIVVTVSGRSDRGFRQFRLQYGRVTCPGGDP